MSWANIILGIACLIVLPFKIKECIDKGIAHIVIPLFIGFLILIIGGLK